MFTTLFLLTLLLWLCPKALTLLMVLFLAGACLFGLASLVGAMRRRVWGDY